MCRAHDYLVRGSLSFPCGRKPRPVKVVPRLNFESARFPEIDVGVNGAKREARITQSALGLRVTREKCMHVQSKKSVHTLFSYKDEHTRGN